MAGSGTQRRRSESTVWARATSGDPYAALLCALSPAGCAGDHLAVRSGEVAAEAEMRTRARVAELSTGVGAAADSALGRVAEIARETAAPVASTAEIFRWAAIGLIALAIMVALALAAWFFGTPASVIANAAASAVSP